MSTSGGPALYEIRVEGVLDSRWAAWFGGLHIETDDTQTVISGWLADQSALHGLLTRIGDLGLCLISVRRWTPIDIDRRRAVTARHPDIRQQVSGRCARQGWVRLPCSQFPPV